MTIFQLGGATVDLVDDVDASVVYAGTWAHHNASPGDYAKTVSETTVVGDTVKFTFTGTWVRVYGARSPSGTEKATYAIDGGPRQYTEESVAGLPKHKVPFFNSTALPEGTHTLVITNYGDSLLLDFFLVGLQDDAVTSETFTQPHTSTAPQSSQTTPALTITETVSKAVSSSSSGAGGYSVPTSPLVTDSSAPVLLSSAQGTAVPSASHPIPIVSSRKLTTYIPSTASPSGISSQQLSSKLSKGASAGLAVGISVFCLLVGGGILACYFLSRRQRRRARGEIVSVPAVVVTEYPSFSPSVEPTRRPDEKRERRFSDIGTSVFSLPPYGYTSHDPQVPTGSDIDDGLVPYNGLIDSKPPIPPMALSPLRRESIPIAPPELSHAESERLQPDGVSTSTLAPQRGRWK